MKVITIRVVDQYDAPVENVARVAVFQAGALVTYKDTDAAGEAEFLLDELSYVIRTILTAGTAYATPDPLSLTVTETATYKITVDKLDPGAVAGPNQCLCVGTITFPSSDEQVFDIQQLLNFGFRSGSNTDIHYPAPVVLRAKDGELLLAAIPKNTRFRITTGRFPTWETKTPDGASARISDVLFPLLEAIVPSSSSLSLTVGQSEAVTYEERYTSSVLLDPSEEQSLIDQPISEEADTDGITFVSSDTTVATVTKSAGVLSVIAVGAGTAVISATIKQLFGVEGAVEELDDIVEVTVA